MTEQPKQWQCGHCGGWVDAAWWRHLHPILPTPTFDEMVAAREKYGDGVRVLDVAQFHTYTRTGDEATRDKPL